MKAQFKEFNVTSYYTGSKASNWDSNNYNHYRISVYNRETQKRTSFDFWASIANPELSTEYEILNAFYCFVSDAISGAESFKYFCDEFGYDSDSRNAYRIWKTCQKSHNKLMRIADRDIYDLSNELSEKYC